MASNPVFNRLDKQMNQGGYAGFGGARGSAGMSSGRGVQDTMSASQLEDLYNRGTAGPVQTGRVTLDDVVMKTMGLFVVLLAGAGAAWVISDQTPSLGLPMVLGGMLLTLALGFAIALKKTISVPLIVLYAAVEGVFVGGISNYYNDRFGQGIVSTAVIATLSVFAAMFVGWKTGIIKVTERSRRIFGMALVGYLIFSLVNVVASFMGVGSGWGFGGSGMLGIAISLFAVGLASYSLAVDFDTIDRAVAAGAPEKYSWLLGHGLIVSLVWLYLEMLRLLARMRE
jgi:uncharacterized YccA/Bax inhibitor family protein